MEAWVKEAWEAAVAMGLTSRWEFWVAVVAALILYVAARRLGPPMWLYLRSIKPPPEVDADGNLPPGAGSPPMPLDKDGSLHLRQKPPDEWL